MYPVDTVRIPRFALLERAEEHLVHTQRIGTVIFHDVVGIDNIEHRFGHLLDCPTADIFAILEDKLGIGKLRTPSPEGIQVEQVVAHDIDIDVDLLRLVLIFQTQRDELVGSHNTIDEIGTSLNHTLVHQFLEGFAFANIAQVVEEHIPETRVHQVPRCVFDTTHIEIDIAPILIGLTANQCAIIMGIHITQVVSRRTGKSWHGTQFQRIALFGLPIDSVSQWWFTVCSRTEVLDRRQLQRQFILRQRIGNVVLVIDREGLTPIALAAEDCITQAVIDLLLTESPFFDLGKHGYDRLFDIQTIEEFRVNQTTLFGIVGLFLEITALNYRNERQTEMTGKCVVTAIVSRNGHNGTRTISGQNVITDIDRNLFPVEGVNGIGSGKLAANPFGVGHTFPFGTFFGFGQVGLNRLLIFRGGELLYQLVFWSQHHKGDSENGIRASGKDLQFLVSSLQTKKELGTLTAADPVALNLFERITPLQLIQSVQHPLRISGNPQLPLLHLFLLNRETTTYRQAIFYLIVCQYSSQPGAPVDQRIGTESQPIILQSGLFFRFAHRLPLLGCERKLMGTGCIHALRAVLLKRSYQLRDRAGLLTSVVVIAVEHLQKCPLRPFVIFGITRAHLTTPIETEADLVELLPVTVDVLLGGYSRMLTGLNRILLSR